MAPRSHHLVLRDVPAPAPPRRLRRVRPRRSRYLFNSYYEAVGPRHPRSQRGLLSRPTVAEVARYRAHVDAAMQKLIDGCDAEAWPELAALIGPRAAPRAAAPGAAADGHQARAVGQPRRRRLRRTAPGGARRPRVRCACFRSTAGSSRSATPAPSGSRSTTSRRVTGCTSSRSRLADRLVTAGEWLAFIADGGYRKPELWLSDGWYAVQEHGWDAPLVLAGRRRRLVGLHARRPAAGRSRTSRSCT